MSARRYVQCAATVAIAVLASSCGSSAVPQGGKSQEDGPATSPIGRSVPVRFDPPTKFEEVAPDVGEENAGNYATVNELDSTIDAANAYGSNRNGLHSVGVTTGAPRWSFAPEEGDVTDIGRPVVSNSGGSTKVFTPFSFKFEGAGTAVDRFEVRLTVVNGYDGTLAWNVRLPAPKDSERIAADVVGIDDELVVVRVGDGTAVVDRNAHKVVWSSPSLTPVVLNSGTLIGYEVLDDGTAVFRAIGARDQESRWKVPFKRMPVADGVRVSGAGPAKVVFSGRAYDGGQSFFAMYDSVTGAELAYREPANLSNPLHCEDDEASTVVCWTHGRIVAFDLQGTRPLWVLDSETSGRQRVDVSTVWHGAIYGATEDGTRVALDARTGKDLATDLGALPADVSAFGAITANGEVVKATA